jgi:hypothetical protein
MKYYTKPVPSDMAILYETYTTKDILDEYFIDWAKLMGQTNRPIIEDACIDDWVIMNHAWESDSDGYHVFTLSASGVSEWC